MFQKLFVLIFVATSILVMVSFAYMVDSASFIDSILWLSQKYSSILYEIGYFIH